MWIWLCFALCLDCRKANPEVKSEPVASVWANTIVTIDLNTNFESNMKPNKVTSENWMEMGNYHYSLDGKGRKWGWTSGKVRNKSMTAKCGNRTNCISNAMEPGFQALGQKEGCSTTPCGPGSSRFFVYKQRANLYNDIPEHLVEIEGYKMV